MLFFSQTRDSYVDAKRAQLCVESVLEHFANRKIDVECKLNVRGKFEIDRKEFNRELWIKNMVDSESVSRNY